MLWLVHASALAREGDPRTRTAPKPLLSEATSIFMYETRRLPGTQLFLPIPCFAPVALALLSLGHGGPRPRPHLHAGASPRASDTEAWSCAGRRTQHIARVLEVGG